MKKIYYGETKKSPAVTNVREAGNGHVTADVPDVHTAGHEGPHTAAGGKNT